MVVILHAYFQLDIGELFFGHKNDKGYDVIKELKLQLIYYYSSINLVLKNFRTIFVS